MVVSECVRGCGESTRGIRGGCQKKQPLPPVAQHRSLCHSLHSSQDLEILRPGLFESGFKNDPPRSAAQQEQVER